MHEQVELRPIVIEDWPRIHEWASTEAACRFQAWKPNTEPETRLFAKTAVAAWSQNPVDRFVYTAEEAGLVVGIGELHSHNRRWGHGELSYAVHVDHWGRGLGTAIATQLLDRAFAPP